MGLLNKSIKKRSFHVMVPTRVNKTSNIDLQVSLVTINNSIASLTIYASKIERELAKRKISSSILKSIRMPVVEGDILEYLDTPESAIIQE